MADATPRTPLQGPRGTRDFYPADMLRRRWIEQLWRSVAQRHSFEEIDGPRFEKLELYTIKSGQGIVSELFSFTRQGGQERYALRPEFTPTLARLYAAKAASLPKPARWFSVGPYFRAERPQRGRLREFLQWNVDVVGDASPLADAEVIACCADLLCSAGLSPSQARIRLSHRAVVSQALVEAGVAEERVEEALALLDRRDRLPPDELARRAGELQLDLDRFDAALSRSAEAPQLRQLLEAVSDAGAGDWVDVDLSIVRGLAYYTGAVFEVHETSGRERAIAGGGRYDSLIELMGGPPTPAVGFAMGDVVLANVLDDLGLFPDDGALRRALGAAPDVFILPAGEAVDERAVRRLVFALRAQGVAARRSDRATRNVGKLLREANAAGARFALLLRSDSEAAVKLLADDARGWAALERTLAGLGVRVVEEQ